MNKNFATISITASIMVLVATLVIGSIATFFEKANDIATLIFVAGGMIVSVINAMTALEARGDSKQSAEAAKDSAKAAKDSVSVAESTLQIAEKEARANALRYRVENGSFLSLQKKEIYVPLHPPLSEKVKWIDSNDLNEKNDIASIRLENKRLGTATSVGYWYTLANHVEFDNFKFETNDVEEREALSDRFRLSIHKGFPKYALYSKIYKMDEGQRAFISIKVSDDVGSFEEVQNQRNTRVRDRAVSPAELNTLGYLDQKDVAWFKLPTYFQLLSHQFFLERAILKQENWKTPSPELLVTVHYTEEVSEHMNQFAESRRMKEFMITCSSNISVIPEPLDSPHERTGHVLACHFDIETLHDSPRQSPEDRTEGAESTTEKVTER